MAWAWCRRRLPHNQPSSFTEKLKRGSPRYIVLYVDILNFDIDVHQYTEKAGLQNLYRWTVWSENILSIYCQ